MSEKIDPFVPQDAYDHIDLKDDYPNVVVPTAKKRVVVRNTIEGAIKGSAVASLMFHVAMPLSVCMTLFAVVSGEPMFVVMSFIQLVTFLGFGCLVAALHLRRYPEIEVERTVPLRIEWQIFLSLLESHRKLTEVANKVDEILDADEVSDGRLGFTSFIKNYEKFDKWLRKTLVELDTRTEELHQLRHLIFRYPTVWKHLQEAEHYAAIVDMDVARADATKLYREKAGEFHSRGKQPGAKPVKQ